MTKQMENQPMTEEEFFDWMRSQQSNNRLTQTMVNGAKDMIASMGIEDVKINLVKINDWTHDVDDGNGTLMTLSPKGVNMIAQFERYISAPYKDMAGVWTIGYGNTYYLNGRRVREGDPALTKAEATKLKLDIINRDFGAAVNIIFTDEIEKGRINQNQFDALVSLAYNIGTRGLAGSSVARNIKANRMKDAANAILLWNKVTINGVRTKVKGLVNRREAERKLFLTT